MPILSDLKTLLEVDIDETIFDDQLLLYANAGLRYLANNKVPVSDIDKDTIFSDFSDLREGDSNIVMSWLHLYTLQRFDRTLMQGSGTTSNWIDGEMLDLLTHLKVLYDNEVAT